MILGFYRCLNAQRSLWFRHSQLPANCPDGVIVDLTMPRNRCLLLVRRVYPHRVAAPFTQQLATVPMQVLNEILTLHEAISPAGSWFTWLLALKCR